MYKDWPKFEVPCLMQRCSHCREKWSTLICNPDPHSPLSPVLFLFMQVFCSCNLWQKRLVLGVAQVQPQQCPCLCPGQRQRDIPWHLDTSGGGATTFVSGVRNPLHFLDHLEVHQCRRGVRVGQKKGVFFGFQWLDAGWGPARAHGSSIMARWLGRAAIGIIWWETEAGGGFRDQWTDQFTKGTALEVHKSYNKKDHTVMGKKEENILP